MHKAQMKRGSQPRFSQRPQLDHDRRVRKIEIRTHWSANSAAGLPHAEGCMGGRHTRLHGCDASAVARRHFALAEERRIRTGYDDARYKMPALKWAQSAFMQPQMMVQDRYFYDPVLTNTPSTAISTIWKSAMAASTPC